MAEPKKINQLKVEAIVTNLPLPEVDPDGLLEYSVVFTDRSLNHMSAKFRTAMQELLEILRNTYNAHAAAVVPGGGSYAMEAVARQFATGKKALVIRNGQFSYRWSQIFDAGNIPSTHDVIKAIHKGNRQFSPAPIDDVVARIEETKPDVVFAPHVETAAGIQLADDYIKAVGEAVHAAGGLFVLDCVASGAMWVDMEALGVDVLISAPQKGWSGSPASGYVMVSEAAREAVETAASSSFALDLKKWFGIADAYVAGNHGYHATMPTDTIVHNLSLMKRAVDTGLGDLRERQIELGAKVRAALADRGFVSVAAPGDEAPSVVVVNSERGDMVPAMAQAGVQIAGGVPLMVDEPQDFQTFRIGLFGLDKLADIDGTVQRFTKALDEVLAQ